MNIIRPNLDGSRLRIDTVQVRFTNETGSRMSKVCCRTLKELSVADENIIAATVLGVLETPLVLRNMTASNQYDVLVAIGVIIRSETYHFELVSNESDADVTRVGLDHSIPTVNATPAAGNDNQAVAYIEEKAFDATKVAIECIDLVNLLLEEQFNKGDE